MAETFESCCIRLKLSDGGQVYLSTVWQTASFSITVLDGARAWSHSVSEIGVKSIARCWAIDVLDFMRSARSRLCLQHPTATYFLSTNNDVDTVQLSCTMDDVWDDEILKLQLRLVKVPDVGKVVCGMLDLLIDTASKLKEQKIEAENQAQKTMLAQLTALRNQSFKGGHPEHVQPCEYSNYVGQSQGGGEEGLDEGRVAEWEGNIMQERFSSQNISGLMDGPEGAAIRSRESGRQCPEQVDTGISLSFARPSVHTRRQKSSFPEPQFTPSQDTEAARLGYTPIKSPRIGMTQGGTRNNDLMPHEAFGVPLSENIMRVLNCLGSPGRKQSKTARTHDGQEMHVGRSHENRGRTRGEEWGLRITQIPSAQEEPAKASFTNSSSALETPNSTAYVKRISRVESSRRGNGLHFSPGYYSEGDKHVEEDADTQPAAGERHIPCVRQDYQGYPACQEWGRGFIELPPSSVSEIKSFTNLTRFPDIPNLTSNVQNTDRPDDPYSRFGINFSTCQDHVKIEEYRTSGSVVESMDYLTPGHTPSSVTNVCETATENGVTHGELGASIDEAPPASVQCSGDRTGFDVLRFSEVLTTPTVGEANTGRGDDLRRRSGMNVSTSSDPDENLENDHCTPGSTSANGQPAAGGQASCAKIWKDTHEKANTSTTRGDNASRSAKDDRGPVGRAVDREELSATKYSGGIRVDIISLSDSEKDDHEYMGDNEHYPRTSARQVGARELRNEGREGAMKTNRDLAGEDRRIQGCIDVAHENEYPSHSSLLPKSFSHVMSDTAQEHGPPRTISDIGQLRGSKTEASKEMTEQNSKGKEKVCLPSPQVSRRRTPAEGMTGMEPAMTAGTTRPWRDHTGVPKENINEKKVACDVSSVSMELKQGIFAPSQQNLNDANGHGLEKGSWNGGQEVSPRNATVTERSTQVERAERMRTRGVVQEDVEGVDLAYTFNTGLSAVSRARAGYTGQAQWSEWLKEAKTERKDESWWAWQKSADTMVPSESSKQEPVTKQEIGTAQHTPETPSAPADMETPIVPSIRRFHKELHVSRSTKEEEVHNSSRTGRPPLNLMVEEDPGEASGTLNVTSRRKVLEGHDREVHVSKEGKKRRTEHVLMRVKQEIVEDIQCGGRHEKKIETQLEQPVRRFRPDTIAELLKKDLEKSNLATGQKGERNFLRTKDSSKKTCAPASKRPRKCDDVHVSEDEMVSDEIVTNVPDADHYEFDQDRTESHVKRHQVWAVYDDIDGMPRSWAYVEKVARSPKFRAWVSWLKPHNPSQQAIQSMESLGYTISCGEFKVARGETDILTGINCFSHEMVVDREPSVVVRIYPRKGEVWALHKDGAKYKSVSKLGPDKKASKDSPKPHSSFRLMEILSDYKEGCAPQIQVLGKLAGFRTIWKPSYDRGVLPDHSIYFFSHRIPAYRMRGDECPNIPKNCWDIDPAGLPSAQCKAT